MRVRKASEKRIGNYIWWDAEHESADLWPLLQCLRFAINDHERLDLCIGRLFPASEPRYAGGDPGWQIVNYDLTTGEILRSSTGSVTYRCWIHPDYCELTEADYDEAVFKKHVYRTLDNFAEAHPERTAEVGELIARYFLRTNTSGICGKG